jgi:hypothetical protein
MASSTTSNAPLAGFEKCIADTPASSIPVHAVSVSTSVTSSSAASAAAAAAAVERRVFGRRLPPSPRNAGSSSTGNGSNDNGTPEGDDGVIDADGGIIILFLTIMIHCYYSILSLILQPGMDGGDLARTQIVSTVEGSRRRLDCYFLTIVSCCLSLLAIQSNMSLLHSFVLQNCNLIYVLSFVCTHDCQQYILVFMLSCDCSTGPLQLASGKPPLPSQGGGSLAAHLNANPSASFPPPLSATASAANAAAAAAAAGDQQNWLWKYRLSASR